MFMAYGLGSKREVKIFILYLMENINYPLDFVTINDIVMQNDFVMYLDFAEAFDEMLQGDLIGCVEEEGEKYYYVTEKGRIVATELNSSLFSSILDKSLEAAFRYLDFKKRGVEARCEYMQRADRRFDLVCTLYEKKEKIFETTIIVDTEYRARQMKQRYLDRPDVIYRGMVALLSGKMEFLFT